LSFIEFSSLTFESKFLFRIELGNSIGHNVTIETDILTAKVLKTFYNWQGEIFLHFKN